MAGFRLGPEDERPHKADASPNFNESVYMNAFDPARRMGGWMRLGNRVNEGHAELSVCFYLPDGRIACQFKRPAIAVNDRFEAGGLKVDVVEPFTHLTMRYEGEVMLLADAALLRNPEAAFKMAPRAEAEIVWDQRAASPLHGGEPLSADQETMYGRDFSLGHFNQHTRVTGEIRIGDQRWPVEGQGWRDHSWGPRYWTAIWAYRLFIANFADGRALMLLKISDKSGRARRLGVLLVDGAYEEVIDLDVITTRWTADLDPAEMLIGVRTGKRAAQISGKVITMAPLRNRRKAGEEVLISRIAEGFTEFSWDGVQGFGMSEYIERLEDGRPVGYPL